MVVIKTIPLSPKKKAHRPHMTQKGGAAMSRHKLVSRGKDRSKTIIMTESQEARGKLIGKLRKKYNGRRLARKEARALRDHTVTHSYPVALAVEERPSLTKP